MNIPTFLYGDSDEQQNFFALFFDLVQDALSDRGWTVPQLTTAQITALTQPFTRPNDKISDYMPNGTIWFNTTLRKLQVQTAIVLTVGATVETITSV